MQRTTYDSVLVPNGSRLGAGVLIFGPSGRLLLLRATVPGLAEFWVPPGGGVEPGESWEQAALREAKEETGLDIHLGPAVIHRHHVYNEGSKHYDLFYRIFVATCDTETLAPTNTDGHVTGHRWWDVDAIVADRTTIFSPRRSPTGSPTLPTAVTRACPSSAAYDTDPA